MRGITVLTISLLHLAILISAAWAASSKYYHQDNHLHHHHRHHQDHHLNQVDGEWLKMLRRRWLTGLAECGEELVGDHDHQHQRCHLNRHHHHHLIMKKIDTPKFRGGDDCAEPLSVCDKDNNIAGENHHPHYHFHPHHLHCYHFSRSHMDNHIILAQQ